MNSDDEMNSESGQEEEDEEEEGGLSDDIDEFMGSAAEHSVVTSASLTQSDEHCAADEFVYQVLTADEIVQHMVGIISDVNTVIQIPATVMRILLSHFKWDREKLMERYFDGDRDKLFTDAHVVNPFKSPVSASAPILSASCSSTISTRSKIKRSFGNKSSSSSSSYASLSSSRTGPPAAVAVSGAASASLSGSIIDYSASANVVCEICYMCTPDSTLTGLQCGHKFCADCWSRYLTTKIMDEGMGQTISCAAHNCDILVDDDSVMKLVSDARVRLKYQHLITNSFVESNQLLHWCPSADCGHAIKVQFFDAKPVTCVCGHTFCFACGENWHDPVQCQWLKKWIKKCDDDSETSNWIAANTRECPKCRATIEKDGGCNHMVCKRCKFDFCWVCLGSWEPHGSSWYNCNRYDEDEAKKARDAQEKSRAALQRYLFYCNRYLNHMRSLKFENKLYNTVKGKMEDMQQLSMSWIEVQFLKKAVDVLCLCRQTLMYTYVFAYYLRRNNQSIIFEDNQKDLENATEQLSEYLERDITSDMMVDIKQKVQDKYRYCDSRRKVLLKHVHEGYEKDLWEYQPMSSS